MERGLSQAPSGAGLGREVAQHRRFPVLPAGQNLKTILTALEPSIQWKTLVSYPSKSQVNPRLSKGESDIAMGAGKSAKMAGPLSRALHKV